MVWPLAKDHFRVQPLMALVPPLVMVTAAWKPPCHWPVTEYATVQPPGGGVEAEGVGVGEEVVGSGVGEPVLPPTRSPIWMPRPLVPRYTRPYTRGSPVMAPLVEPHWCWSSL